MIIVEAYLNMENLKIEIDRNFPRINVFFFQQLILKTGYNPYPRKYRF